MKSKMSWFTEEDFLDDLDYLSFDSNRVPPRRFANINRSLQSININSYWESDDEDVVEPSRGRGRLPTGTASHLQVMNEIQRDVRSTVGNCYQNESIELYYNILQNEDTTFDDAPEDTDKQTIEVSVENTGNSIASLGNCNGIVKESNVLNGDVRSLSSMLSNGKQYSGRGCKISRNSPETYPAHIDIKSNNEFPSL